MRYNPNNPVDVYAIAAVQPVIVGIVIVLAVAVVVMTMVYTVQPEEQAVVKRFGAVIKTTGPGLHFKMPFWIDNIQLVATERVLKEEFGFRTAAADIQAISACIAGGRSARTNG